MQQQITNIPKSKSYHQLIFNPHQFLETSSQVTTPLLGFNYLLFHLILNIFFYSLYLLGPQSYRNFEVYLILLLLSLFLTLSQIQGTTFYCHLSSQHPPLDQIESLYFNNKRWKHLFQKSAAEIPKKSNKHLGLNMVKKELLIFLSLGLLIPGFRSSVNDSITHPDAYRKNLKVILDSSLLLTRSTMGFPQLLPPEYILNLLTSLHLHVLSPHHLQSFISNSLAQTMPSSFTRTLQRSS